MDQAGFPRAVFWRATDQLRFGLCPALCIGLRSGPSAMKILLADDDEISRKIIASFLARFGYEALVVQNGAEAWEVLQSPQAPPLAICDWMMW